MLFRSFFSMMLFLVMGSLCASPRSCAHMHNITCQQMMYEGYGLTMTSHLSCVRENYPLYLPSVSLQEIQRINGTAAEYKRPNVNLLSFITIGSISDYQTTALSNVTRYYQYNISASTFTVDITSIHFNISPMRYIHCDLKVRDTKYDGVLQILNMSQLMETTRAVGFDDIFNVSSNSICFGTFMNETSEYYYISTKQCGYHGLPIYNITKYIHTCTPPNHVQDARMYVLEVQTWVCVVANLTDSKKCICVYVHDFINHGYRGYVFVSNDGNTSCDNDTNVDVWRKNSNNGLSVLRHNIHVNVLDDDILWSLHGIITFSTIAALTLLLVLTMCTLYLYNVSTKDINGGIATVFRDNVGKEDFHLMRPIHGG